MFQSSKIDQVSQNFQSNHPQPGSILKPSRPVKPSRFVSYPDAIVLYLIYLAFSHLRGGVGGGSATVLFFVCLQRSPELPRRTAWMACLVPQFKPPSSDSLARPSLPSLHRKQTLIFDLLLLWPLVDSSRSALLNWSRERIRVRALFRVICYRWVRFSNANRWVVLCCVSLSKWLNGGGIFSVNCYGRRLIADDLI